MSNGAEYEIIFTPEACEFVDVLHRKFEPRRRELLARRAERQKRIDAGELPVFLPGKANIRSDDWRVAPVPKELERRWVEITGPASSAKMVINALNSGADVFMADAEDSESPTWKNIVAGQMNLRDATRGLLCYTSPEGKPYKVSPWSAVLMFRPRGWHLIEKHATVDGEPVSATLLDLGLYFYHNARILVEKGSGPYFYFPKLESHEEARLLNDVFEEMEKMLGVPRGATRVTPLIETILAAFEMNEIIYELRERIVGLNCGRWDYIFSFIKKLHNHSQFVLPDRARLTMDKGFLAYYVKLLIQTCHRRGIHAMGGMAAQIPIKDDKQANEQALARVMSDKTREVLAGHDGTWVAHPGLVPIAKSIFERGLGGKPNQLEVMPQDIIIASDLLEIICGVITKAGLHNNISIAIQYLESWFRGVGCVPINHLMEDAATVEIARSQVWQWIRHGICFNDGQTVKESMAIFIAEKFYDEKYALSVKVFLEIVMAEEFPEFLTVAAYGHLP